MVVSVLIFTFRPSLLRDGNEEVELMITGLMEIIERMSGATILNVYPC